MRHVTFSNDVSKSDGLAVTIEERHPDDVHPSESGDPFVGQTISMCPNPSIENENDSGEYMNANGSTLFNSDGVEILAVKMGILKCGYRYRVSVPVDLRNNNVIDEMSELQLNLPSQNELRITRIDNDDLRAEIGDGAHVNVFLSARQRGPYLGRLFVEVYERNITISNTAAQIDKDNIADKLQSNVKHITIQIEASIMGKGMGTPQLRNGVMCLGKLVGYDSDEDTEWQGFD